MNKLFHGISQSMEQAAQTIKLGAQSVIDSENIDEIWPDEYKQGPTVDEELGIFVDDIEQGLNSLGEEIEDVIEGAAKLTGEAASALISPVLSNNIVPLLLIIVAVIVTFMIIKAIF